MRTKPIEPHWFWLLATLYVATFVFQVITLLVVLWIVPLSMAPSDGLQIIAVQQPENFVWASGQIVRADRPGAEGVERCLPILRAELSRYDAGITKLMRLKRIILCSDLTVNGRRSGGLALGSMGTILVNVDSLTPAEDDILRRAIHHEIYHVIEANLLPPASIDLEWEQLNPRGFQYGGEEILEALDVTHQSPGQRTEIPGLLNYYCMVSAGEDRAELFSTLMVHPDELHAQGASDEILLKKLAYLKLRLMAISREFELMLRHNGVGH